MTTALVDQRKAQIKSLESVLTQLSRNAPDQPTPYINTHHFAEGVYVRAYYGVKDSMVVSQVHKHEHITVLCAGQCRVVSTTQKQDQIDVYKDFAIMVTPPMTQRALYFLENTTILTIHPNPENIQDVPELEKMFVVDNFKDLEK